MPTLDIDEEKEYYTVTVTFPYRSTYFSYEAGKEVEGLAWAFYRQALEVMEKGVLIK